jgi:hypothetical protein
MTERDIEELAAILVHEHGRLALQVAESRRDQHRHERYSDAYRLWDEIADAVARLLESRALAAPAGAMH